MPETEKPFYEGLAEVEFVTGEIRRRKDKFIYETVKKTRLNEYEDDGWEVAKENVNTYRMKKPKVHDVLFEDRVWALFARLGFEHMNKDRNFKIRYSKEKEIPGKQIDVFATDSETVIIVECKSAETRKRTSFSKDIAEIGHLKEPIFNTIKKHYAPQKPKITWLFATNNYIVSKPDKLRLEENNIFYFSQDDIQYYEHLVDLLGSVARYQLFGSIFRNQSILGLNYSTPAYQQARTFQRGRRTCKQMASRFFREECSCNVRPQ